MKKCSCLIAISMFFAFIGSAGATIYTWSDASGVDNSFATLANWSPALTSFTGSDDFNINYLADKSSPELASGSVAVYRFKLGNVAAAGTATLDIKGGTLTTNRETYIGMVSGAAGVINLYSGSLVDNKSLYIGYAAAGTINVYGGDFFVKTGYTYTTTVGTGAVQARLNILGGNFTAGNDLIIGTNGLVNIENGTLRVAGDFRTQVQNLITSSKIGAFGVFGDFSKFNITYISEPTAPDYNKTIITAIPEPATMGLFGIAMLLIKRDKK